MRRFSLLLCLLVVAALGWIIGSAEALTTTQQRDAVLPKTHLTLEAVNTGFKDSSVATGIRTADAAGISYELLSVAIEARPHSTNTILPIKSTRGVQTHRNRSGQGDSKMSLLPQIGRDRPRRTYL